MKPGAFQIAEGTITINEGRQTREIAVKNTGSRSIQVGSHFHFAEANGALSFDREQAIGMRIDIPSGTSVRFEPGEEKTVTLVEFSGRKTVRGLNGMADTYIDERGKEKTLANLKKAGWMEGVIR
ncbi:urease subunit beta [Bacillus halotolerans]|uniref:Urease subunit beta n=1 Tax=Bacillus halotolerans TaxID=260554 RepID=A0A9Q2LHP8_9BACI|nr:MULTISPECIES: urease subunit beta [Bacillus]MBV7318972.1 urease subunit beta [Halalkalibacterium halodurans]QQF63724.1 urease subunit beta [Bacillus mojavensis]BDG81891.1 urease subunit beta [Bacillus subtilis]AZV49781.1 urease subunit beta [Bacillus halotolerans]KUP29443.1 urease subunit beta [Bacillus halotolerans]